MKSRFLTATATLALLAGCAQPKEAPMQTTAAEREIRAAEKALERALESSDPTATRRHRSNHAFP